MRQNWDGENRVKTRTGKVMGTVNGGKTERRTISTTEVILLAEKTDIGNVQLEKKIQNGGFCLQDG